jgi:hypothetical protein
MPVPAQYGYPVKRPGLIVAAQWTGPDSNLKLQVTYVNEFGNLQVFLLSTTNAGAVGDICLPTGKTIQDINRDAIIASVRMATFISKHIPGSKEWLDAMTTGQDTMNFQMAIGNVKIKEARIISDVQVELDMVKAGTSTPVQTVVTDFGELGTYTFAPDTQVRCAAGAIEKEYPSYIHDYPTQVLTQAQKDDIIAYVLTLPLWV